MSIFGVFIDSKITLGSLINMVIVALTALIGGVTFVSALKSGQERQIEKTDRVERKVEIHDDTLRDLAPRLAKVEAEVKANGFRQDRAFEEIKSLLISNQSKTRAAVVRRPQQ